MLPLCLLDTSIRRKAMVLASADANGRTLCTTVSQGQDPLFRHRQYFPICLCLCFSL
ncbi:predicted protein [Arabidopsis lyrata subsp. lyrata]|uniref:Predicted protein n=1 Tax=Arabidopsis lyrata subsp. lyrata TaxID=81972 RepID=D7MHK8_ARALL|nr:predicted protein [Arabidopsis lyrata subsp. lyrata]